MTEAATEPLDGTNGSPRASRLQRLRSALATRDWLGLGIEILVVTLGVLLAFQIEQWAQQRQKRAEERQFLERLSQEYRQAAIEMQSVNDFHRRTVDQVGEAFDARNQPERLAALANENDFACGIIRYRAAPYNETAAEEMLASGRLNIVADLNLRAKLREVAAAQAGTARMVNYARQLTLEQMAPIVRHMRIDLAPGRQYRCRIEWEELFADQLAVNAAVRSYRVHGLVLNDGLKTLRLTQDAAQNLACKLGMPDCMRS